MRLLARIARCDVPTLIEGETGTGKELAARAIHYTGARCDGPFVPVNCGAIPDNLIENELFGHRKGAFTGADHEHVGLIEGSHKGTLFLDEIEALSAKSQVSLLRFLQDQQYRPLGGKTERQADVRIIAASNTDLSRLAAEGGFRADLLYRIKVMYLQLPPLRERNGDVTLLSQHFLEQCATRYGQGEKKWHAESLLWLERQDWPGNIRELENLIVREYLLSDEPLIRITLPEAFALERRQQPDRRHCRLTAFDFKQAKNQAIAEFEHQYLVQALAQVQGNVAEAARQIGKERRALGKLLKKHGINPGRFKSASLAT
jgi:DNA-binding NtrC family response regulator